MKTYTRRGQGGGTAPAVAAAGTPLDSAASPAASPARRSTRAGASPAQSRGSGHGGSPAADPYDFEQVADDGPSEPNPMRVLAAHKALKSSAGQSPGVRASVG